jgi:hypothetical protein
MKNKERNNIWIYVYISHFASSTNYWYALSMVQKVNEETKKKSKKKTHSKSKQTNQETWNNNNVTWNGINNVRSMLEFNSLHNVFRKVSKNRIENVMICAFTTIGCCVWMVLFFLWFWLQTVFDYLYLGQTYSDRIKFYVCIENNHRQFESRT